MNIAVTFTLQGDVVHPGVKNLIWRLVRAEHCIGGWVKDGDDGESLCLHLVGDDAVIRGFIQPLPSKLYPPYYLRGFILTKKVNLGNADIDVKPFKVIYPEKRHIPEVKPDRAPIHQFLLEMINPDSRRYCYPFWSTDNCGPLYSALIRNPFVRRNTVLAAFPPCKKCKAEASDISNPLASFSPLLACPECGPQLFLRDAKGEPIDEEFCVCAARRALKDGKILALQSLFGGFQLFVDASNPEALKRLRERRKIADRPISVIARDVNAVRKVCECSLAEEKLLMSYAAPVVIMDKKKDAANVLPVHLLNPDGDRLGISLAPSVFEYLLMAHVPQDNSLPAFDYLAAISSNWNGYSITDDLDESILYLYGIADLFLCHDLKMTFGSPSSVAVIRDGAQQVWRRSRGYVPTPFFLRNPSKKTSVSFGMDEHATVALCTGDRIIPSQYIGSLHCAEAAPRLTAMLERLCTLFDTVPNVIACDANMGLFSSGEAAKISRRYSLPLVQVQSQYAAALAGMLDNGLEHAVSVVLGNGSPGPDGTLWGAELLETDLHGYRRLGSFESVRMPGGQLRGPDNPKKQLFAYMQKAGVSFTSELLERLGVAEADAKLWRGQCTDEENQFTKVRSMSGFMDAVSAGLGIITSPNAYRGQGIFKMESTARYAHALSTLPTWMYDKFAYSKREDENRRLLINWNSMFRNFADSDWIKTENIPDLCLAFHVKVADAIADLASYGARRTGTDAILLTGDIFMNGVLFDLTAAKLRSENLRVFTPHKLSMNESSVCVGQAWYAINAK